MITQPNPQLEARPAAPDVQHRLPIHLPGRPRLRPTPQGTRAIDTHIPNIALAGLQLLIGYEWLLAGGDKLLLGAFPAQLGGAGLVTLFRPLAGRYLSGTSATMFVFGDRLLERLAPIAAIGAGLLGVSYFFLDGLPKPWFVPSVAFGGSIDTGLFLAVASVVLIV
ncbi:MAG: hypothetical protein E6J11_12095, partial [Chloroflexi bacterium]